MHVRQAVSEREQFLEEARNYQPPKELEPELERLEQKLQSYLSDNYEEADLEIVIIRSQIKLIIELMEK
jgi:hypothetical protein